MYAAGFQTCLCQIGQDRLKIDYPLGPKTFQSAPRRKAKPKVELCYACFFPLTRRMLASFGSCDLKRAPLCLPKPTQLQIGDVAIFKTGTVRCCPCKAPVELQPVCPAGNCTKEPGQPVCDRRSPLRPRLVRNPECAKYSIKRHLV